MAKKANTTSHTFTGARLFAAMVVATVMVLSAVVVRQAYRFVDRKVAFGQKPPKVVLVNRPVWMSDSLAEQIINTTKPLGLHSAFDHQLLVDTARALQSCPWVKEVIAVRREYDKSPGDTLAVECQYRMPAALGKWGEAFWLVDNEGYVLPAKYSPQELDTVTVTAEGKVNLRIIEGVAHPPALPGQLWPGADLAAGLEMARVLANREYTEQIPIIDVSNFARRLDGSDSQIVLITKFNTQIRWGRPPNSKDAFEDVPVGQKLLALESMFRQFHRVDANQPWVDISLDKVMYPKEASADARAPG